MLNADFRINGKVIETERLILRPFRQTDLEDFYEYASVRGVGEMAGWKHHESIAESQSIMNSFISNDKVFAICLKENNKVIRYCWHRKVWVRRCFNRIQGLLRQRIRLCFE